MELIRLSKLYQPPYAILLHIWLPFHFKNTVTDCVQITPVSKSKEGQPKTVRHTVWTVMQEKAMSCLYHSDI